ncbi:hypothetical protein SBV1_2130004 [Verrucomicrobia bacterium]|nr:hypothetical protein SBV1_2130004 [Verrucomicrobiota bacterium]
MLATTPRADSVPKLCGADFELGNLVLGVELPKGTGALASHLLLREFAGVPLARKAAVVCQCTPCTARRNALTFGYSNSPHLGEECERSQSDKNALSWYNPQDWSRKFLSANGSCAYIDLDHLELCLPEVRSARDHVAATHAMLRLARAALESANARMRAGVKIVALANNSDGQGHSYGSHLNFLITRRAWNDLFERRLHNLLFLAAYQASSIVFTGQGKVGSENNRPPVDYQISQRADYFEVIQGAQTTYNRPIVNSRNEALCGSWRHMQDQPSLAKLARLHVIFFDQTLCQVAGFLKVGVMQILLAMIESECVRSDLLLEDAVEAVRCWSHDPTLHARAALTSGRQLTAVELQLEFFEAARAFVESGACDGIVPEANFILKLWGDTLEKLSARDFAALSPRLDWVLKWQLLERVRTQRSELSWGSPQIRHLDFMFSSLQDGLYWACERQGAVETIVSNEQIGAFCAAPPEDTRAWTRSQLLRLAQPEQVERMDWDSITFSLPRDGSYWPREVTVNLANPLGYTKAECACIFERSASLEEALELLGASTDPPLAISASNQIIQVRN